MEDDAFTCDICGEEITGPTADYFYDSEHIYRPVCEACQDRAVEALLEQEGF